MLPPLPIRDRGPPRIDSDGAFKLLVQISQFTVKFDDGTSVLSPRLYDEWQVDYRQYSMDNLVRDIGSLVHWGSCQALVISYKERDSSSEITLVDNKSLADVFLERLDVRSLGLWVDIVDKKNSDMDAASDIVSDLETNLVAEVEITGTNILFDWDNIEIMPILDENVGSALPVMDDDTMFDLLGLNDNAMPAQGGLEGANDVREQGGVDLDALEEDELPAPDTIPGEDAMDYDREDPPMAVGTIYASMEDFREAVHQHAIKGQFELETTSSSQGRFRGKCKADGCPWHIVARPIHDGSHCGKQVKITLNQGEHFCASTGRIRTKMASYHWVAKRAIPLLRKNPTMKCSKLKEELEDKYQITMGYSTVWAGKEQAEKYLFGTWEESFGMLYNFKAEVENKMPGSIVEVEVTVRDDGVYFCRFFCCFKPSIDGFLSGCRPYLSIDSTALNGRWNAQLASATGMDGHNWIYPVAFGFFDSENTENWTWFMQQVQKAIGSPQHLVISSDKCKGLENAVKSVYPGAEHRECFYHLMKNFTKRFQGPAFGRMYYAARTFEPDVFEYTMNKVFEASDKVKPYLEQHHSLLWMRSKFSTESKCDHITNNVSEVWNSWVKDVKDLPVAELADTLRIKFMRLYEKRRKIAEKLEGHAMLPVVVRQLNALSRQLSGLSVDQGGRYEGEVTEITLHNKMAYSGAIRPLPGKSKWPKVYGFRLLPPLVKRPIGRQRKNRIPSCIEGKGNKRTKGCWQVQCKGCLEFGHRSNSSKCRLNGTKKRKSRSNVGRPRSATSSTTKKQKVAENTSLDVGPLSMAVM